MGEEIEASTLFASVDNALICSPDSDKKETTAPGIWYLINDGFVAGDTLKVS